MDAIEFDRQAKSYLQRRPFQRFRIVFIEGDAITVAKPKSLFTHAGSAVFTQPDGEMMLFDNSEVEAITAAKSKKKANVSQ